MNRLFRAAFLPLSLLILWIAALQVPLPVFVERPGGAVSLGDSVEVEGGGELAGDFLLTTVNLRRGTFAGMVEAWFDEASRLVPSERLIPPGETSDEYFAGQRSVFQITADVAAAVALDEAGYDVSPADLTGDGVRVAEVIAGTPADGVLEPGDIIRGVNGSEVRTAGDLQEAITAAGERPVVLRFERSDEVRTAEVVPQVDADSGRPIVGVRIETVDPQIPLPVDVEVDSGRIGGPSAGLLIGLTVYDKVDEEVDLAAGRRVAGTGTLEDDGQVGAIGFIDQKVIAADRDGVDVFLAPESQAEDAAAAVPAGSELEVLGVGTFDEAVDALRGETVSLYSTFPPRSVPGG